MKKILYHRVLTRSCKAYKKDPGCSVEHRFFDFPDTESLGVGVRITMTAEGAGEDIREIT